VHRVSDTSRLDTGGTGPTAVERTVDGACIGELAWVGRQGPDGMAVTPLRLGDRPAVAMPYAFADRLRGAGGSPSVTLALTDSRMTSSGWAPLLVAGRPTLQEDVEGRLFAEQLLGQELRKNPPARVYADTPLLRRENWWYLPRVVLVIEVEDVARAHVRTRPGDDGVLVTVPPSGRPEVDVVTVPDWTAQPLDLAVEGGGRPVRRDGAAALLAHNFSVPDLERWVQRVTPGTLRDGRLHVDGGAPGPLDLPPPLRLWERVRRHRELERGCRRGIAVAERARRD
jgi:hypothetical protein